MTEEKTILVVDDDADYCHYLESTLSHFGYKVVVSLTGKEALKHIDQNGCFAVLLDIFLPDIDGVEVARKIRKKKGKAFTIIGISSSSMEVLKEQFGEELSLFTYIFIKPFNYLQILELFQENYPPSLSEKIFLQQLIVDYQASVPERLDLLYRLIQELKERLNERNLEEFRLQVHKLAGNAGLYGYDDVTPVCKKLDKMLGEDLNKFSKCTQPAEWIKRYEKYYEEIKKGFEANTSLPKKKGLEKKIIDKTAVIGVIGLGNIGLALLDAFGKAGFSLVGYDSNPEKIKMLEEKQPYLNYMDMKNLFDMIDKKTFKPLSNPEGLQKADVVIISVSTSIDRYGTPNLTNLRAAFQTVFHNLKKHQLVILQSSTYPGTTREELLPILLKSNLNVGIDFYLAHVPEIADIGNLQFNFVQMPRIVSGITPSCVKMVSLLYENISAKVIPCSTTEVAESAKLLQNAFRLINISFINEMKILFDTMKIDVWEVIAAAATKPFGFMPFYPSPAIGGDCIPIAPFYLVWKAKSTGGPTTMLEEAGRINEGMPRYIVQKIIYGLNLQKNTLKDSKILILGVGYKKDVNDIRESVALKIIPMLKLMEAEVDYHDPYVKTISSFPTQPDLSMESIEFDYNILHLYDAVVVLADHVYYDWEKVVKFSSLVIDTRNISAKVIDKRKIIKA